MRTTSLLGFASLPLLVLAACEPSVSPHSPSPPPPQGVTSGGTGALGPNGGGSTVDLSTPGTAAEALSFIADVNKGFQKVTDQEQRAGWINENFITDDTDALAADASEATMTFLSQKNREAVRFNAVMKDLPPDVQRQFKRLRILYPLAPPNEEKERAELAKLTVDMTSTYGKGKYCSLKLKKWLPKPEGDETDKQKKDAAEGCLTLGDLSKVLEESRDWDELLEAWKGWRTVSVTPNKDGVTMKQQYQRYVEIGNKGARDNGFKDVGELWRSGYDMDPAAFQGETDRLWKQVKPLYDDLHCYARKRLREKYKGKIADKAPIPAHLLGNMWTQDWTHVEDILRPYKGEPELDVTKGIEQKKWSSKKMVSTAEDFFVSLGLQKLPDTFWDRSLFDKPRDREVVCHASAWPITMDGDVRIKVCAKPNEEDLITLHHELGHDYYFLAYDKQIPLFQDGANDGFHEGIGDTLALSVTPDYLKKLGLIGDVPKNDKAEINVLMHRALEKVAFLPFGKLIDEWRWDVFSGKVTPANYEKAWDDLILKYQGVAPPVARSEADFDAGAKFHVPANTPYMRYFLAAIYQFQFHRALCKASGYSGPLYKCSIYGSKEAGARLEAMLAMGASKPWPEALKAISGETALDASAILDYFQPLDDWLKKENQGEQCGW